MKIFRTRTPAALGALALLISVGARAQVVVPASWAAQAAKLTAKPAPSALPTAEPEAWTAILENVRDNGAYTAGDGVMPTHFGFEDVQGSTASAHTDDSVDVFGAVSKDDGLFHPLFAGLTSEKWTLDAKGDWRVDQWMFMVDIDGGVHEVTHKTLRVSPDLDDLGEQKAPIYRGGKTEFDALVARWSKYKAPEAK